MIADIIESNLATRQDIKGLARDMNDLKQATSRGIKEPEQRMVIKSGSLLLATVGTMLALSKLNLT